MKPDTSFARLYTPAGEGLAADPHRQSWDAYPRPQLRRDSYLCLNGSWQFAVTDGDTPPATYDRTIRVPFAPQSLLSGIGETVAPGSHLHYRRTFTLPGGFHRGRVLLHIGAANQIARVWLNGHDIGTHQGGYVPFTLDITDYLQAYNTLCICIGEDLDSYVLPYGKSRHKRGGMWYTPVTGLWQTVWLESVPRAYVSAFTVTTHPAGATIRAHGVEEGLLVVTTPEGKLRVHLTDGVAEISLPHPRLWCPADPYLYYFTLTAGEDTVDSYFALRTLDTRVVDGIPRLCLNGQPVFFHAVLDQGYWSDGLFLPAEPAGYTEDIEAMQALGFNTLRKHIKIEPEQFYYDCDRLGMLVWQDMVNNGDYNFLRDTALPTIGFKRLPDRHMHRDKTTRAAFEQAMEETVTHLSNHPCIVGWTIFNEGWGQFDSRRLYERLKTLDPTRFIDTASGWFAGADSDVVSEHVYFKPYRFKPGKKPVFLSEFGGYSYKPAGHVFNIHKTYGYRFFTDETAYRQAVAALYERDIVPAVAKGLCGAVYTQLADVEDETNGLLSYDRRVCKVDPAAMRWLAEKLTIKTEQED